MLDSGHVAIEIKKRPYVPVIINGSGPFSFLLDTGSLGSNVSHDLAEPLGLHPDERDLVKLNILSIGLATFNDSVLVLRDNTKVSEITGARVDGFIGSRFLSAWVINIDYPGKTFRLTDGSISDENVESVNIRVIQEFPLVPVMIHNSGPYWFLIDTGAHKSIISNGLADKLKLPRGEEGLARGAVDSKEVHNSTVKSISIGSATCMDLPVDLMDCSHVSGYAGTEVQGYIGHNFLKDFSLTMNFPKKSLSILQPPNHPFWFYHNRCHSR